MARPSSPEIEQQNRKIRGLMARINDRESSEPLDSLVKELAEAKRLLAEMMRPEAPAASKVEEAPKKAVGLMLGPETTGLRVETAIKLRPVPTGIYHLLDPETDPLVSVTITNLTNDARRLCVTSYIEGISSQAIKTIEFSRSASESQGPSICCRASCSTRARRITELRARPSASSSRFSARP